MQGNNNALSAIYVLPVRLTGGRWTRFDLQLAPYFPISFRSDSRFLISNHSYCIMIDHSSTIIMSSAERSTSTTKMRDRRRHQIETVVFPVKNNNRVVPQPAFLSEPTKHVRKRQKIISISDINRSGKVDRITDCRGNWLGNEVWIIWLYSE